MEHIYHTIPSPQELSYKDFYTEMVHKYPSGSLMVEVGVYHGRSFSYLIIEMLNAGKKFDCVAVDACPWDGEPCIGFHKHMEPLKGHYRVMFEKVDSFVAANNFQDGSIDMCFIDANHTYEFVKRDIEAYLPKIKKGGTLAGHDWSDDGVKKAVNEIFGYNNTTERQYSVYKNEINLSYNPVWIDKKQDLWRIQII